MPEDKKRAPTCWGSQVDEILNTAQRDRNQSMEEKKKILSVFI